MFVVMYAVFCQVEVISLILFFISTPDPKAVQLTDAEILHEECNVKY
jgi:hypothetical protein